MDKRRDLAERLEDVLVSVIGGETLMYKDDLEFLYETLNPNTNVTIYTNGTIYDEELLKRLAKKFILNIQISIDGYGLKNDYIRAGTHFNDIKENVKSIHQISQRTCIVFTVSLLNCFELYDEIKKLIDEFNICIIINVVIYPEYYSVRCLSKELKNKVLAEIKKIETAFPEGVTNMIALYSALESSSESTFEENLEIFLKDLKKKDLVFNFDTDFYLSPFLK